MNNISISNKTFPLKFIALLSTIRWYNILLTVVAQYFSAYAIGTKAGLSLYDIVSDYKLHCIVLSSVFCLSSGFIINNFYDFEKDLINRPKSTLFNRIISKNTTLNLYLIFNLIALIIAFLASFNIFLFFLFFTVALWFYSHKIQKLPFLKEFIASLLSVTSFFAILLHFSKFYPFIFVFGLFFMTIVYSRELIKQFINYKGDVAFTISSIPVILGLEKSIYFTYFIFSISVLLGVFTILIYTQYIVACYYIAASILAYIVSYYLVHKHYFKQTNLLFKIMLVAGIATILFIK